MQAASGGLNQDGTRYLLNDVHALEQGDADLWNPTMELQMDHRGHVRRAGFMQPNQSGYSGDLRAFYLRDDDTGKFWSAPYAPVNVAPDRFLFSVGTCDLHWEVEREDIRVTLDVAVPWAEAAEVWRVKVTNLSNTRRSLSLYSLFPVGLRSVLAQHVRYDERLGGGWHSFFDYYVRHEDLARLRRRHNHVYCLADRKPTSWEFSEQEFAGEGGLAAPAGLLRRRLRSGTHPYETACEPSINAFQYAMTLPPGRQRCHHFVFGPAIDKQQARRVRRKYLRPDGVERAAGEVQAELNRHAPAVRLETPDREFTHFVNVWLPRRAFILGKTIRFTHAPQGRNVIQDAMGATYVLPQDARHWFVRIWSHQHRNGWTPHGMPFHPEAAVVGINKIPHKDINVWGPSALRFYVLETGDAALLDEPVPFADAPDQTVSLYEHICLGLDWLLADRTPRGLCRIGQGDWNDPLNMAGYQEKGESVWLSQALVHALETWAAVAQQRHDPPTAKRYRREAAKVRRKINELAWDGKWYARGFTDAGRPFGVNRDREGKIFLNAQSWALIAGIADERQTASCIRSVERMLMSPAGPMTLAPAYTHMREDIGKLTQKIPGWNENGSVYCHAAVFYAYALLLKGDAERGFGVLRTLLPGWQGGAHSISKANQLPLYVPNFYRGTDAGRNAGLSSHNMSTGTVSWYYRTVVEQLAGVAAEPDGLRLTPRLPPKWPFLNVWRRWRGAEYDIRIRRSRSVENGRVRVFLDGSELPENLLPVSPPGSTHLVQVMIPMPPARCRQT